MKFFFTGRKDLKNLFIIISFICLLLFTMNALRFRSAKSLYLECVSQRELEIIGIIDTFYLSVDRNNKGFKIVFENGSMYHNPIYLKSLNGYISKGDYLLKPKGSFKFYKLVDSTWIEIIDQDSINCENILRR